MNHLVSGFVTNKVDGLMVDPQGEARRRINRADQEGGSRGKNDKKNGKRQAEVREAPVLLSMQN